MFAAHGVHGASLRQAGTASGAINLHIVGDHFGNRKALATSTIDIKKDEGRRASDSRNYDIGKRLLYGHHAETEAMDSPLQEKYNLSAVVRHSRRDAALPRFSIAWTDPSHG
ncbi:hypothetical protein [Sphingobium sp.]|uniref:hypothetical protein n=1 Tax=Sphingobium sp. TaxID=1912891 RepID=UPI002B53720E|nr:hypothetical protein [Sphingobium sp.]HUD90647.1 hypothetical protein [Sphingobium sp.]